MPDFCLISEMVKSLFHLHFQGRPSVLAVVLPPASADAAAGFCPSSRVAAVVTEEKRAVGSFCTR